MEASQGLGVVFKTSPYTQCAEKVFNKYLYLKENTKQGKKTNKLRYYSLVG